MILGKIKTIKEICKTYNNWFKVCLDSMKLSKGNYMANLSNGLRFEVRAGERDINILNEVFISGSYNEALPLIKEDSIIIDIGAHIGSFSVIAGGLAKKGRVYAYEPFKDSLNLLTNNLAYNNISNVKSFPLAITDKSGTSKFYLKSIAGEYAGNSIYGNGESIEVETISLNDVFIKNKIIFCNLLKIDCEGAEYNMIYNTPVDLFKDIHNIILEYHAGHGDPIKLKQYLESLGYLVKENTKGVYLCTK